jgi:hypothetical protein
MAGGGSESIRMKEMSETLDGVIKAAEEMMAVREKRVSMIAMRCSASTCSDELSV